jgi:rhamnogalacturonyl hydrolase YesR
MKKHKKQTFTTFLYKNEYTTGKNRQPYNQGVALFGKECYRDLTPDDILNAFQFVIDLRQKAGMQDDNIKQIEFILKYLKTLKETPEEQVKDIKTPEECTLEK